MGIIVIVLILLALLEKADNAERAWRRRDIECRIREDEEETDRMAEEIRKERDNKKMRDIMAARNKPGAGGKDE
jgi:hypothetical protein